MTWVVTHLPGGRKKFTRKIENESNKTSSANNISKTGKETVNNENNDVDDTRENEINETNETDIKMGKENENNSTNDDNSVNNSKIDNDSNKIDNNNRTERKNFQHLSADERQKVLDKLEKLLSHTKYDGDGEVNVNEIANASVLIKQITDKYGITLEEIQKVEHKEELVEAIDVEMGTTPRIWARSLSAIIASFYECRSVRSGSTFYFIGFAMDVEVASEMFKKIYSIINTISKMQAKNRVDFSFGVVVALKARLDEITVERNKAGIGGALVVVKKDAVDDQVSKIFPNLINSKQVKYNASPDFYNGYAYGSTMEIFAGIKDK